MQCEEAERGRLYHAGRTSSSSSAPREPYARDTATMQSAAVRSRGRVRMVIVQENLTRDEREEACAAQLSRFEPSTRRSACQRPQRELRFVLKIRGLWRRKPCRQRETHASGSREHLYGVRTEPSAWKSCCSAVRLSSPYSLRLAYRSTTTTNSGEMRRIIAGASSGLPSFLNSASRISFKDFFSSIGGLPSKRPLSSNSSTRPDC